VIAAGDRPHDRLAGQHPGRDRTRHQAAVRGAIAEAAIAIRPPGQQPAVGPFKDQIIAIATLIVGDERIVDPAERQGHELPLG